MKASGLLILDKSVGMTSHDAVQRARRLLGERRVGHAGTLDPLASGVLLVCAGWAARLIEYLVGLPKVYETTVRLGQTTASYDAEGEVIRERPVAISDEQLAAALDRFRGPIRQQAPIYSAIKQDGRPLYELARSGEAVEAPVRDVVIHELTVLGLRPPFLDLRVGCSSGTYIRSLAHDLGEALGTGGYVSALRRTAVGPFTLAEAVALESLTPETAAARLLPPERIVSHMPRLAVDDEEARRLLLGQRLIADESRLARGRAAAFAPDGRFIGIVAVAGEAGDVWQPEKMIPTAADA